MSGSAYDWSQTHRCGQTVKVDCDDGAEKDQATAGTGDMVFSIKASTSRKVVLGYSGLASDPLVTGAPIIDIVGTLTIDRTNKYVGSPARWMISLLSRHMFSSMGTVHTRLQLLARKKARVLPAWLEARTGLLRAECCLPDHCGQHSIADVQNTRETLARSSAILISLCVHREAIQPMVASETCHNCSRLGLGWG